MTENDLDCITWLAVFITKGWGKCLIWSPLIFSLTSLFRAILITLQYNLSLFQDFFKSFYWPNELVSVHKNRKKSKRNLANIQPYWPTNGSIIKDFLYGHKKNFSLSDQRKEIPSAQVKIEPLMTAWVANKSKRFAPSCPSIQPSLPYKLV